ncbi:MAG: hypothetical protein SFU27_00440, partial [Thermonemataceae bacterium]|nr:hypothetical protein [Thermonemataceae bacterium]
LRTLPLHPSQVILIDNEQEFKISLEICYNYEFLKQILSYSCDVIALEPDWFVKKVKEMHESALKKYL